MTGVVGKGQYFKENSSLQQNSFLHNQIFSCTILSIQYTSKSKEKRVFNFLKNDEKIKAYSRQLVQLSIWGGGLGISDLNT